MDRLAPQPRRLARQVPAHPLGLRRDRPPSLPRRAVHILVNDLAAQRRATSILSRGGANLARLHFHHWPTDRVWLRDSGPIFVKIAEASAKDSAASLAVTNWKFNAWAKYSNFRRDDQIPHRVAQLYNIPEIKPEIPPPPAAPSSWKP